MTTNVKFKGKVSETCTISIRKSEGCSQLCVHTEKTAVENPDYAWVLIPDVPNSDFKHKIMKNGKMITWSYRREVCAFNCSCFADCKKLNEILDAVKPKLEEPKIDGPNNDQPDEQWS